MELYRIVYKKFADRVYVPGFSGRWNDEGQFVVYTASNCSLSALENIVLCGIQTSLIVPWILIQTIKKKRNRCNI